MPKGGAVESNRGVPGKMMAGAPKLKPPCPLAADEVLIGGGLPAKSLLKVKPG